MATPSAERIVETLVARHGRTFSSESGIRIERNTPAPLFRLLCLSLLISARISNDLAMRAARALVDAGWTTPDKLADSTWAERVRVLNQSGYARYDESTARYLGDTTDLLNDRYSGDLRALREAAGRDPGEEHRLLTEFTGVGDVGAGFFLREVQKVWNEVGPYLDLRTAETAAKLSLPTDANDLRDLVDDGSAFVDLVAAIVRSSLAGDEDDIIETSAQS